MQLPSVVTTPTEDLLKRISAISYDIYVEDVDAQQCALLNLKKLCVNMKRSQSLVPVL